VDDLGHILAHHILAPLSTISVAGEKMMGKNMVGKNISIFKREMGHKRLGNTPCTFADGH
jgi:hypothetical protein